MLGLLRRAFSIAPEERAARRQARRDELQRNREEDASRRQREETCSFCRGSRMCIYCGGARNSAAHELGADCGYCRDGRCSYC